MCLAANPQLREQARDSFDGSVDAEDREQAFFDSLVKANKHQPKPDFRTERERAIYFAVESASKQREKEKTKIVQERSQLYAKGSGELALSLFSIMTEDCSPPRGASQPSKS